MSRSRRPMPCTFTPGAVSITASAADGSFPGASRSRRRSPSCRKARRPCRCPHSIWSQQTAMAYSECAVTMVPPRETFAEILSAVAKRQSEIASGPIVPKTAPQEIRDYLSRYDFAQPMTLDEVGADVERMLRTWQVHVTHPRYFGLFNPSVTTASIVADTLVAMYNPQLATWRTSPAANEIERHTLAWLSDKFGLPPTAIASFTSGGAEANLSAVVVALTRAFPAYGQQGLRGLSA